MHLHSNYSDGKNSLEEMVQASIEAGYTHIAFSDHVWKTSSWLDDYIEEINYLKKKYNKIIHIYSAVEAKVVDLKGNIDLDDKYVSKLDFIYAAFHRIPIGNDKYIRASEITNDVKYAIELWYKAFMNVLKNPKVVAIVHPTSIFLKSNILLNDEIFENISIESVKNKKMLEINVKRQVPNKKFLKIIIQNHCSLIIGSDSHSVEEIEKYKDMIKYWNEKLFKLNLI
jgi:HisJ family histidinol phosphate phosphatase